MAYIAGMFIVCVFTLSGFSAILFPGSFFPMLAGDLLALFGAYVLFIVWEKRPIRVCCEHCERIILSNTPWVCGYCRKPNMNANEYPFVDRCGHCGNEPKAYRCHHCDPPKLIFLTEDHLARDFAYRFDSSDEMLEPDKRVETLKKRKERKEDLGDLHELALARERLIIVQKRLKREKKLPVSERLRAKAGEAVELDEAARQLKAENAEECKGDKSRLRRMNAAVDAAAQSELAGNE